MQRAARDHGQAEARRLIALAEEEFGLGRTDWAGLKKGDWRKGVVAGLIRNRSLVDNGWLLEQLHMGARNSVSHTIRRAREFIGRDRASRQAANRLEERAGRS